MALVSVQNILAPFENKTHLFTIVIIAALFGLWRATGGSVSIRNADIPVGAKSVLTETTQRLGAAPAQPSQASQGRTVAVTGARSSQAQSHSGLDALLQPSAPAPKPAKKVRERSALDNIEKTLGMR